MHRIDTDGHVLNLFDEGDPAIPRRPTQIDKHWMNAVQEEIANVVLDAGLTLVKGTWTQLRDAVRRSGTRAYGIVDPNGGSPVLITNTHRGFATTTPVQIMAPSGGSGERIRLNFAAPLTKPPVLTATIAWPSGASPGSAVFPIQLVQSTGPWNFVEFYVFGTGGAVALSTLAHRISVSVACSE